MTKTLDFTWYVVPNIAGKKRAPKWGRSCALDSEGCLWLPAAIAPCSETAVLLSCSFDCVGTVMSDHHLYVPASWMEQEFPKLQPLIGKIRHSISNIGHDAEESNDRSAQNHPHNR